MNARPRLLLLLLITTLAVCACAPPPAERPAGMTAIALMSATPLQQNDAGTGADAACEYERPLMIGYGEVAGALDMHDDEDCFGFLYTVGDILEITLVSSDQLVLRPTLDAGGDLTHARRADATSYVIRYAKGRDRYSGDGETMLWLSIGGTGAGRYTLNLSKSAQNDAGSGKDAASATDRVTLGSGTFTGFVGYGDECDEYFYDPPEAGSTLVVTVRPDAELDAGLRWWVGAGAGPDWQMLSLDGSEDSQGQGGAETMAFPAGTTSRPSFHICRAEGTAGSYAFDISVK